MVQSALWARAAHSCCNACVCMPSASKLKERDSVVQQGQGY
jgi:hypothetical protein